MSGEKIHRDSRVIFIVYFTARFESNCASDLVSFDHFTAKTGKGGCIGSMEISCHGWAGKKVWKRESWRGLSSFKSASFRWRPAIEEKEENSGPAFGATSTRIYVIVARENPRLDAELPASSSLGIHSTRLFFRASESVDIVSFPSICTCSLDTVVNLSLLPARITLF